VFGFGTPPWGEQPRPNAQHVRPSAPQHSNATYPAALQVLAAQRRAGPVVHGARGVGVGGCHQVTGDLTAQRLVCPQRLVVFIP
jgi:hypothetical protein